MSTNNKNQYFESIYNENAQSIIRLCYMYLKDLSLAEDATQETFIKAYRKLNTFNRKSNINTWLTAIAINTCKNIMRQKSFGKNMSLDEAREIIVTLSQMEP
ncbi:MAG: sigma-70 family RNA polymerase sigma factor [Ruminococcus sp.]|nr:sigma-70 family RNA polymerase sigma factor [Ruminococcus sp.]